MEEVKYNTKTIAIVANTCWNIHNFRLNVLSKLQEKNYKIYVIASLDEYIVYKEKFPEVIHIPLHKLKRKSTNPFRDLLLWIELTRIYKRLKPDIILHYTVKPNIYGGFAAGILRIPSIAVITGLGYAFIHKGLANKTTILLYRLSARFHKKFIFENSDDLLLFNKLKILKEDQGISIKGCGVNVDHFLPGEYKENEAMVFTFIGRLLFDKGIREFIEAAHLIHANHPKIIFWIIGKIDHENPAAISQNDLDKWVSEDWIVYKGFKKDIRNAIAESDCIVLPSYREAIARTITEGMAMLKPVISTDTPGCREAIDHNDNGYLVPIKDSEALANAMEKMINLSTEEREKMGKKGRSKVLREFDDKIIANQIVDIIEDAL